MFGRRKRDKQEAPAEVDPEAFVDDLDEQDRAYEDALLEAELEQEQVAPAAPSRPQGPWDVADVPDDETPRVDLGGLRVPVPADTEVRLDVSPEGTVVAATLVRGDASVQVNAFAAPRTEGIWSEVLDEIATSLTGTGGRAERVDGPFGPELRASVPTQSASGGIVLAPARFVGVDGPRWFVRALFSGPAATDDAVAAPLEQALRDVVVVRGADPMAVRDPLPLHLPAEAQQVAQAGADDEAGDEDAQGDPLRLAERGPEITETR